MTESSQHIDRISLTFINLRIPFLLLLVSAAILFTFWYYRDTVPAVRGWKRGMFVFLRAAALTCLIAGLAEPIVRIIKTITLPGTVAVLLDTSSSMEQEDDPARKTGALNTLSRIHSLLNENAQIFGFDNQVYQLDTGEPSFNGPATDILGALREVSSQRDVYSIILVSDGRWNLGEDPASYNLPVIVPIHSVAAGSFKKNDDVVLKRISVASIGHEGTKLPVEIVVTSSTERSDAFPVEVIKDNNVVAEGIISFKGSTLSAINLEIPLEKTGDHTFTAVIKPVGDTRIENNMRSFSIHVIKSSFRVLLISPTPSPDLAFIRRVIESDEAFDLHVAIGKGVIRSPENAYPEDISDFDTVMLLDGGGSALTPDRAQAIVQWISRGGGLWFLGSSPPENSATAIERILPVTLSRSAHQMTTDIVFELTESGRRHFITSGGEVGDSRVAWQNLPPLSSILPVTAVSPGGRVLALAAGKSSQGNPWPAVVTGRHVNGKVLIMPVSGLWRWQLMMEGAGKSGIFFDNFVEGAFRWLTSDIESSPLIVTTDSRHYLSGQEIAFEGRLFDNVYMPVPGAEISLIVDDDPGLKIFLEEKTPAVYTGTVRSMEPGTHIFKAEAFLEGGQLAETSGDFTIEEFSLEMLDSAPDPVLLGAIASRTGGISVTTSGIDSVLSAIKPHPTTERHERDHHLSLSPLMPALAVVLLAVEWIMRKRRGMI
ncbi:hypothetical protein ACFL1R_07645 [Candidatus Latescibacterota bacterium]